MQYKEQTQAVNTAKKNDKKEMTDMVVEGQKAILAEVTKPRRKGKNRVVATQPASPSASTGTLPASSPSHTSDAAIRERKKQIRDDREFAIRLQAGVCSEGEIEASLSAPPSEEHAHSDNVSLSSPTNNPLPKVPFSRSFTFGSDSDNSGIFPTSTKEVVEVVRNKEKLTKGKKPFATSTPRSKQQRWEFLTDSEEDSSNAKASSSRIPLNSM